MSATEFGFTWQKRWMLPRGRYPHRIPFYTRITIPFLIAGFRIIVEKFLQALLVDQIEAQHLALQRQMAFSRFSQGEREGVTELSAVCRSWVHAFLAERDKGASALSAIRSPSNAGDPSADDPKHVRNTADEVGTKAFVN